MLRLEIPMEAHEQHRDADPQEGSAEGLAHGAEMRVGGGGGGGGVEAEELCDGDADGGEGEGGAEPG